VTVVGSDGAQREQTVQTGLVGDDSTEIVSGLRAGQEIVVSTLSALTTTTGANGNNRGGGPGGGIGFRFVGPGG
jgi:macrolide-specific efflux system membrane fusion protein